MDCILVSVSTNNKYSILKCIASFTILTLFTARTSEISFPSMLSLFYVFKKMHWFRQSRADQEYILGVAV